MVTIVIRFKGDVVSPLNAFSGIIVAKTFSGERTPEKEQATWADYWAIPESFANKTLVELAFEEW